MKYVPFLNFSEELNTRFLMGHALRDATQSGGADFVEVCKRARIVEQLEKLPPAALGVQLEDADHDLAAKLMKAHKWARVDPKLRDIIQGVVDAKEPPSVMLPEKKANGRHRPSEQAGAHE